MTAAYQTFVAWLLAHWQAITTYVLPCAASFFVGAAWGSWRKYRVAAEHYRMGRTTGVNETTRAFSKIAPDELPVIQPRRTPFAGRGRP